MQKKSQIKVRRLVAGAIAGSAVALAANTASATLIVQDGFNYTTPGNLPGQTNPYENQTWALTGTQTITGPAIVSGSLSYPVTNAPSSLGGNSINLVNNTSATRLPLGNPTVAYSQANNAGTTLYYSMLLDVTSTTDILTGTGGGFIAGFNNLTGTQTGELTGAAGALMIRKDTAGSTTYHLGISQNPGTTASRTFDNTDSLNANQTYFVVVGYNFGATAGTDTSDLWIYSTGALPSTPGTPTVHGPYGAEINTSVDSLDSVFFRDNGGGTNTQIQADDLRVGTAWADVTADQVPEPASLGLLGLGSLALLRRRGRK